MSAIVIDASVAVKWFLPEIHAEAAGRVLKSRQRLLAPDLIWAEIGNTLWKKNLRHEITLKESHEILQDFLRFPLHICSSKALLNTAWSLAIQHNISVYDSLYLALAIGSDCCLITADRKFYESLRGKAIGKKVVWVEDAK